MFHFVRLCLALACLGAPLHALTVAEITAIHDARGEPYELRSYPVDDDMRRNMAEDLAFRPADVRNGVLVALSQRFAGATIHVYRQTDTSLISNIVAFEHEGEVVLLHMHSVAFFEIPQIVERRVALFDAILAVMDAQTFPNGWTADAFAASTQAAMDYGDGDRSGDYPGWHFEARGGYQTLGVSLVPDWIAVTVTTLTDCPPRYPQDGWAVVFLCAGS